MMVMMIMMMMMMIMMMMMMMMMMIMLMMIMMMTMTMIRMEIKDVCELMGEAGNFKLSRPTTFFNIRHYSYKDMLVRIIMMVIYGMIMVINISIPTIFFNVYSS